MLKQSTAIALTALALTGCAGSTEAASAPKTSTPTTAAFTRMEQADSDCLKTSTEEVIKDGGMSMSLDTKGEDYGDDFNVEVEDIGCILGALDSPEYVLEMISRTTSQMGVQETEWDGIKASWTYHPDPGLNLLLVDSK